MTMPSTSKFSGTGDRTRAVTNWFVVEEVEIRSSNLNESSDVYEFVRMAVVQMGSNRARGR